MEKSELDKTTEQKYAELLQAHADVLKERNELRENLADVKVDNDILKRENTQYSGANQVLQARVNKLESTVAAMNRRELRLNFTALQGRLPILWIKAVEGAIDHKQFARLRDGLKNTCPGIELVVFTEGQSDLYELGDDDLNRMGLARITGVIPEAPEPVKALEALEDKGEREED